MRGLLSSPTVPMSPGCCPMHSTSGRVCRQGIGRDGAPSPPLLRCPRRHPARLPAAPGASARAAAQVRITQPALWRQVRDLEKELGVPLVERVGRRSRVTSAGEGLLLRSRALLADVDRLVDHAQAVRGGNVGSLSVAGSPQMIQSVLAPFLTRYLKSREQVDVRLLEEGGGRGAARVGRGWAR